MDRSGNLSRNRRLPMSGNKDRKASPQGVAHPISHFPVLESSLPISSISLPTSVTYPLTLSEAATRIQAAWRGFRVRSTYRYNLLKRGIGSWAKRCREQRHKHKASESSHGPGVAQERSHPTYLSGAHSRGVPAYGSRGRSRKRNRRSHGRGGGVLMVQYADAPTSVGGVVTATANVRDGDARPSHPRSLVAGLSRSPAHRPEMSATAGLIKHRPSSPVAISRRVSATPGRPDVCHSAPSRFVSFGPGSCMAAHTSLRLMLEHGSFLGSIDIAASTSLHDVRVAMMAELDGVPSSFVFIHDNVPIGLNQESKKLAEHYLPTLRVRYDGSSSSSTAAEDSYRRLPSSTPCVASSGRNVPAALHLPHLPVADSDACRSRAYNAASLSPALLSAGSPLSHASRLPAALPRHSSPRMFGPSLLPRAALHVQVTAADDESHTNRSCLSSAFGPDSVPLSTRSGSPSFGPPPLSLDIPEHTITVMFSAPLAYLGEDRSIKPMPLVDHDTERELICRSCEEAGKAVKVSFDFATTDHLRSAITRGCSVLHYSGHANSQALSFEDGYAGVHFVRPQQLRDLFMAGGSDGKPDLVVVSACSSRSAGEAFVAAGVQHVVCVERSVEVQDRAAGIFTRAFYLALLHGKSVRSSFEIAVEAVKVSPNIGLEEFSKFVLLPEDMDQIDPVGAASGPFRSGHGALSPYHHQPPHAAGSTESCDDRHAVSIFPHLPSCVGAWQRPVVSHSDLPGPPEGFLGRTLDLYDVVSQVLRHRLVSICGCSGIGKTALALAAANYISERRLLREGVLFIPFEDCRSSEAALGCLGRVLGLVDHSESAIVAALQRRHCLLVCDGVRVVPLESRGRPVVASSSVTTMYDDVTRLLARLLEQTRSVKFLLTCESPISAQRPIFAAAEKVHELQPLTSMDAARLLLRRAPRRISPQELGCSSLNALVEKLSVQSVVTSCQNHPGRLVALAPLLRTAPLKASVLAAQAGHHASTNTDLPDLPARLESLLVTSAGVCSEQQRADLRSIAPMSLDVSSCGAPEGENDGK